MSRSQKILGVVWVVIGGIFWYLVMQHQDTRRGKNEPPLYLEWEERFYRDSMNDAISFLKPLKEEEFILESQPGKPYYVRLSWIVNASEKSFGYFAEKGDSLFKRSNSDTIVLIKDGVRYYYRNTDRDELKKSGYIK